jgi:hypothetical protein
VTVPSTVADGAYNVKEIGPGVFENKAGITEVSLPNSILVIGAGAFKNCTSLSKMTCHD